MNDYYVYIVCNQYKTVLYTGMTNNLQRRMTNNLQRRITEHKEGVSPKSFTYRYNCKNLVFFERYDSPDEAIQREKQIKAGSRKQKLSLIEALNPAWDELYESLF